MTEEEIKIQMQVDPWAWAFYGALRLTNDRFQAARHKYLIDFMQSEAQKKVVMKATQAGYTAAAIIIVIHSLIHKLIKQGVLYLFPNEKEVTNFSQSRFKSLIDDNPSLIKKYIHRNDVNNVSIKRINGKPLYFAGASATQNIQGLAPESVSLRSKPVDMIVYDEKDLMNLDMLTQITGRMGHVEAEDVREIVLSNPTIPGYGIAADFEDSDQRHWGYRCGCREWTIPIEDYEKCVHPADSEGERGYLICRKCGSRLEIAKGQWIKKREHSDVAGWLWSWFENSYKDPMMVINALENATEGVEKMKVYNTYFGLPYIPATDALTEQDVYHCCGNDLMSGSDRGPCAMGVDVGDTIHAVIGKKLADDRFKLVWVDSVTDYGQLHEIARRFNVKVCVIDAGPEGHSTRDFQNQEPYLVYRCRYQDNPKSNLKIDDLNMTVDRTDIFDKTHELFIKRKIEIPRKCPRVDEFVRQVTNAVRIRVANSDEVKMRTGKEYLFRYRPRKTGIGDHFRSALNYFLLATYYVQTVSEYDYDGLNFLKERNSNEYTHEVAFA